MSSISVEKNKIIFREGDDADNLYIIKKGKIRIVKQVGDRLFSIAVLEEKDFLGEVSIFDNQNRSASAYTLEDTELEVISKAEISKELKALPEWVRNIMFTLSERLRHTSQMLAEHKIVDDELSRGIPMQPEEEVLIKKAIENG